MNQDILTISQLNTYIKDVISAGFPQALWVCGEVQRLRQVKGHVYFDLVEKKDGSDHISASISAVIWAGKYKAIQAVLKKSENGFELKDDIEIKVKCKVDFWEPRGSLSIHVEEIDPTYTLGRLAQEKKKLIEKLQKKGTLDQNKKLDLPLVPLNVGLITSFDSAAYNDIISEIEKSKFGFCIYLRNTIMQGKNCQKDVCLGLDDLAKIKDLDVVVIARGGGSQADLSCFDSETIAERIAKYKIPVLSGIGHEIDLSVTDLAAHTYAKTPTAIAQFLVQCVQQFLEDMEDKVQHIMESIEEKIGEEKQRLKNQAQGLQQNTQQFLKDHNEQIIRMTEVIKSRSPILLKDYLRNTMQIEEQFKKSIQIRLRNDRERLENYIKLVDFVHPDNTLKRGFSITRTKSGKAVRKISDINELDTVMTELIDGTVESLVQNRIKKKI